jgi:hypothetical protein
MARHKSDLELEIDSAVSAWVKVDKAVDPMNWQAWTNYRSNILGLRHEFEKLTVPTPFPPATIGAAKQYVDVLKKIRRFHGGGNLNVPSDPAAWMGEI